MAEEVPSSFCMHATSTVDDGGEEAFAYDEVRMIALAPEADTLYYVAFVDRGEVRRIISLRRAERREVKHYVETV